MIEFGPMHDAMANAFGEDATYLPADGDPVSMKAVPHFDAPAEEEGGVYVRRTTVDFRSGQVKPRSGDRITLSTGTWYVDRQESDDGYITTVVLGRKES
ncbi:MULTISPECIES: hypothetical protein [unclassified Thioalkalivibrio]|uniref:head-tail joining protein n=1 Tax=unclassified Thioalkalivibrio TaxID=2621013 RepID=UPI00036CBF6F|nr:MULTISPECIES: hypothetical protein [unclassified Thioalkalivibrio]